MYQLMKDPGMIRRLSDGAEIPKGHRWYDEYRAWVAAGNQPQPVALPYSLHSPEHFRAIRDAAFAWMEDEVKARGYDSIANCTSYFNSGVERYRLEARAMVAWRDDVNQALEHLVLNPPEGIETWEQVRALLPQPAAYAWPATVELPLDAGESAQTVVMS
ncbi:TPA: hypothetical protein UL920_004225 [Stenotrophomonas maltophilia]|nr:hypothetical protein [Stenotrophomonas maltophilia]HEL4860696.1 hypothetical protein [Stenotrophomonas maltophilia]HEL7632444.1 hypothetical protein [Stenotrophomonas maltophilia]HEL7636215.1 hypothetical protein [Stenotrophomonas maltophilia]